MSNVTVVREAMAAQIGRLAFPALRSLPEMEGQINPPVGIVMLGSANYGTTLQGATGFLGGGVTIAPTDFTLDYLILVAQASTIERFEAQLAAWIGFESDATAVSVPAAVAADATLGGVVAWCVANSADRPGPVEWNGVHYFGTRIHFSVSLQ